MVGLFINPVANIYYTKLFFTYTYLEKYSKLSIKSVSKAHWVQTRRDYIRGSFNLCRSKISFVYVIIIIIIIKLQPPRQPYRIHNSIPTSLLHNVQNISIYSHYPHKNNFINTH
jgi:hypothetical protein